MEVRFSIFSFTDCRNDNARLPVPNRRLSLGSRLLSALPGHTGSSWSQERRGTLPIYQRAAEPSGLAGWHEKSAVPVLRIWSHSLINHSKIILLPAWCKSRSLLCVFCCFFWLKGGIFVLHSPHIWNICSVSAGPAGCWLFNIVN